MRSACVLKRVYLLIYVLQLTYGFIHRLPSTRRVDTHLCFDSLRIEYESLKSDRRGFLNAIQQRSRREGSKQLNGQERKHVYELIRTHLQQLDGPSLASLVSSLGNLENLHREGNVCSSQFSQVCEQMNAHELANSLLGFGKLGVDWEQMKEKERIYARLARQLQYMDDRSIADTLYAIGLLSFRWSKLPSVLQSSLMNAAMKSIHRANSFTLSNIVWSLAKIGVKWSELSISLQQLLLSKLKSQKDTSPQQSSKILWSLGAMGFPCKQFPDGFLDQSLDNVNKIKRSKMGSAISASQTLTGIAKTGLTWHDVSAKSKSSIWEQLMRVSQSTNDKGIANSIWAMGTIG